MVMKEFTGKVAFVMGAASKRGLGHAIAVRLAKEGASVVVADKYEAPQSLYPGDEGWRGLKEVVEEIETMGREALGIKADVSISREVDKAVETALDRFKKIDILVNCTGIVTLPIPVLDFSEEDWGQILAANLTGAFLISKAVARDMVQRKEGGKIVHISSTAGKQSVAGGAAYGASKHGIIGLVQALALELAPYRINVNAVCPGYTMTNIGDERFRQQAKVLGISVDEVRKRRQDEIAAKIPLGRVGMPDDVANLVLFLVSHQSDYMTGQSINISGGSIMH